MTEPTTGAETAQTTSVTSTAALRRPGRALRGLLLGAAFAASFVAGGVVLSGPTAVARQAAASHMGGPGGGAWDGLHAQMRAHVERLLAAADATPEQKAKIHEIIKGAMRKVAPYQPGLGEIHRDMRQLLSAPVIDRAALEQLRAQRVSDVDQTSRILVGALADAAEVLTPEQRAKFAAELVRRQP